MTEHELLALIKTTTEKLASLKRLYLDISNGNMVKIEKLKKTSRGKTLYYKWMDEIRWERIRKKP
jgi:uncharacterized protein involved in tolerance to divalent cations